ncbi:hypothetical protein ACP70R_032091 [Stipagrostis hirtigluma subsp. patula]
MAVTMRHRSSQPAGGSLTISRRCGDEAVAVVIVPLEPPSLTVADPAYYLS